LLIDELSLGLSPLLVENLLDAIGKIYERWGTSILLVEQDVQTALEYAGRGYVLETGRIVLSGSASDLLENPRIMQSYLGI
jgi:branched-chain amino acid transport system ATP-binding protein